MDEKLSRLTFQVLDVSCTFCVKGIKQFLEKQSGSSSIKMNEMLNIFYIDYDPDRISEKNIEEIVRTTGYKVVKLRSMRNSH